MAGGGEQRKLRQAVRRARLRRRGHRRRSPARRHPPAAGWPSARRRCRDGAGVRGRCAGRGETGGGSSRRPAGAAGPGGETPAAGGGGGGAPARLGGRPHDVVAIEPDEALVRQARETYPGLSIEERDILGLGPDDGPFDLVVCVGNVMVYLAEGTERAALRAMRSVLGENGRILIGFHLQDRPPHAHAYTAAEFEADLAAAGLRVDLRAGTYQLHPANDAYGVWVLSRAPGEASG
ncbi:class I SAM-dependent methyltransferase [Streptomyces hydrogenans]|uniref:class I SAM-dependent methyltransferase n=1 Tax=Streptomyces hydrogenans TaxID=1873719 RepID=UPI0036413396